MLYDVGIWMARRVGIWLYLFFMFLQHIICLNSECMKMGGGGFQQARPARTCGMYQKNKITNVTYICAKVIKRVSAWFTLDLSVPLVFVALICISPFTIVYKLWNVP